MISLQPFEKSAFDQLISWSASPELLMQFAGPAFSFPLTHEQLALTVADTKRLSFSVVHNTNHLVIGHAEIYFPNTRTAHLCRILIDQNYRGKGLGSLTVQLLLAISFARDGVEEASLNVYDWNTVAVKCYEKAGFTVHEGNTTLLKVKDQVWTTLNMRLAKKKWESPQPALVARQYDKRL